MKFKILLAGSNSSIITDLFMHKHASMDFLTTSMHYEDMYHHLKYYKPDLFIFCMGNEVKDNLSSVTAIRNDLSNQKIPFAIICDSPSEDSYRQVTLPVGPPQLLFQRPITAPQIQENIFSFLSLDKNVQWEAREYTPASGKRITKQMDTAPMPAKPVLSDASLPGIIDSAVSAKAVEKKKILVIDDSPNMLKSIKGHLQAEYEVATAINGVLARRFLMRKSVDLILLDYEMPDEDGVSVLQSFRKNPDWKSIPVIFLTGINDTEKIQKALTMKPQGYLLKPIEHDKLLASIHQLIG